MRKTDPSLREARPLDYPLIARLLPELGTGDPIPSKERWARSCGPECLVIEAQGQAAGFLRFELLAGSGYVRQIVVAPEFRRRGWARFALLELADRLRARGCRQWTGFARGHTVRGAVFLSSVVFIAAFGLILLRFRRWWPHRRKGGVDAVAVGLCCAAALFFVLLVWAAFQFHSRGGNLHSRYLFSGLWIVSLVMAYGLSRHGKLLAMALCILVVNHLVVLSTYVQSALPAGSLHGRVRSIVFELAASTYGVSHPRVWALGALTSVAVGLCLCVSAILDGEDDQGS